MSANSRLELPFNFLFNLRKCWNFGVGENQAFDLMANRTAKQVGKLVWYWLGYLTVY